MATSAVKSCLSSRLILFRPSSASFSLRLSAVRCFSSDSSANYSTTPQSKQEEEQRPEDEVHVNRLGGNQKGIVVFSMRRFRYRNAMSRNFMKLLNDAMQEVKFDTGVRCVVLRSEVPKVFCAGADLKERLAMTNQEVTAFTHYLRSSVTELHNLPMPTIAAIDGAALGGGLEMALGCDIRIAGSNAKVGLIETSLAILPGAGGTQRLPRVIGVPMAKELIFTARVLDGREAKEKGIVSECVEQNEKGDAAYQKALQLAEEILPNGPIGVRMAKAAINRGMEVDIDSGMRYEEAYYAQVIPTKDRIEGLKAFREKRRPKYEGH